MKLIDWNKPLIDRNGKTRIHALTMDDYFYTKHNGNQGGASLLPHDKHGRCIDRSLRGNDVVNIPDQSRSPLTQDNFVSPTIIRQKGGNAFFTVFLADPYMVFFIGGNGLTNSISYDRLCEEEWQYTTSKLAWRPCYNEKKHRASELFALHEEDEEEEDEDEDEEEDDLN